MAPVKARAAVVAGRYGCSILIDQGFVKIVIKAKRICPRHVAELALIQHCLAAIINVYDFLDDFISLWYESLYG